ncbi:UNVERIFIED_CONTAM: hypothetical protein BEN50_07745 [Euhalothece sp. KZN 001]
MKAEYDFSKGERGKFYDPHATFKSPIYLDDEAQEFVRKKAEEKGVDLNELVNEIVRKEMNLS